MARKIFTESTLQAGVYNVGKNGNISYTKKETSSAAKQPVPEKTWLGTEYETDDYIIYFGNDGGKDDRIQVIYKGTKENAGAFDIFKSFGFWKNGTQKGCYMFTKKCTWKAYRAAMAMIEKLNEYFSTAAVSALDTGFINPDAMELDFV